jgi:hypothetical protein
LSRDFLLKLVKTGDSGVALCFKARSRDIAGFDVVKRYC